jgi:hypothetical protein
MPPRSPWSCARCHAIDRVHGKVSTLSIVLEPEGARLLTLRSYFDEPQREADIRGWGAILYEMVTGQKPPGDGPFGVPFAVPRADGPRSGPASIRPAAQRLALKCLVRPPHALPTIQQALSEIRLLGVLSRQQMVEPKGGETPLAARAAAAAVRAVPASPAPHAPEIPVAAQVTSAATSAVPEESTAGGYGLTSFGQPAPTKAAEPAPEESGPCPQCDGSAIFLSRARSTLEHTLVRWGVTVCRCHCCYHRWIVLAGLRIGKSMPTGPNHRKTVKPREQ